MEAIANKGFAAEDLKIRAATREDAAAIAELSCQLGYEATPAEIAERIKFLLVNNEQVALVACLGGKVVGWIEAALMRHLQSPAHTMVGGLVVKEGMRSLGVGKQLCTEIEAWSQRQGIQIIRVNSRNTREEAHRFYLREGYQQTKTSMVFEKVLS